MFEPPPLPLPPGCTCTHHLLRCCAAASLFLFISEGSLENLYVPALAVFTLPPLPQKKVRGLHLSVVHAQVGITPIFFSFPSLCHLFTKAHAFLSQATIIFPSSCFISFLCVTSERERKSSLLSLCLLDVELSYAISFIVNNAFSSSAILKSVLNNFRKLVRVESYFNLESLGLQIQTSLLLLSFS